MFRKATFLVVLFCFNLWKTGYSANCANQTLSQCSSISGCTWDTVSTSCICSSEVSMDIIFAMDSSGSIGTRSFVTEKQFVATLCNTSLPTNARVGIIEFATSVYTLMNFSTSSTMTRAAIASFVMNIYYTGGNTYTTGAINQSINMFDTQSSSDRSKVLALVTDGNPNADNGDNDVCRYASELKSRDITVVIIGVGDSWDEANVDCLVDDPSTDIITVTSFSTAAFTAVLPQITGFTCPVTYHLVITEVKTPPLDSGGLRFVEIYNPSTSVALKYLKFTGLINGYLNGTNATLNQSQYLVVYDGTSSNHLNCTDCVCTKSASLCTTALYIGCGGSGLSTCSFSSSYNSTNFYVSINDTTDNSLVDSVKYSSATWPNILTGYTYELKSKGYDNDNGGNWQMSCNIRGTPGADPVSDCSTVCDNSLCQANGGNATCNSNGKTCDCNSGYYSSGISCYIIPSPSNCWLYLSANDSTFIWDHASTDTSHQYDLSYTAISGKLDINLYARLYETSDVSNSVKVVGAVAGTVQTVINGSKSQPPINCTVAPTQSPTHAPTYGPTPTPTWEDPFVYIGGDICAQERCGCYGAGPTCTKDTVYKTFTVSSDGSSVVTFSKYPTDFPFPIIFKWNITNLGFYSGNTTNGRRLLQTTTTTTTTSNLDNNIDISPFNGTTTMPGTDEDEQISYKITFISGINVNYSQEELFLLRLISCTVVNSTYKNYSCFVVYPSQLYMIIQNKQGGGLERNVNQKPIGAWVWGLIAGLCAILLLAAFVAYRYWSQNKQATSELREQKQQYIEAVHELDGFDADKGVQMNPMATGIPGQNIGRVDYNQVDENNQDTANQRADVAVEKFAHRQEMGQIQQGKKR